MPGQKHELVVDLIKKEPRVVAALLDGTDASLPRYTSVGVISPDLSAARPAGFHADVSVLFRNRGRKRRAVVAEVQLKWDPDKPWVWPEYQARTRADHRVPTILLVIVVSRRLAERLSRGVLLDGVHRWAPTVVLLESMPRITSLRYALKHPRTAVLSAVAHARDSDALVVLRTAVAGVLGSRLETAEKSYYCASLKEAAPAAVIALLEKLMGLSLDEKIERYRTRIERKGLAKGLEKGLEKGLRKGLEKGREEGLDALRGALQDVLRAQRIRLSPAQSARVAATSDTRLLRRWVGRAATGVGAAEVFRTRASPRRAGSRTPARSSHVSQ